jgi:chemotaxis signal transduction protein
MASYKGIAFPAHVAPLVRHMESLNDHRETLASLRGSWDTLSLLGHLSDLKTDIGGVRSSFETLTGELLGCLAEETLSRTLTALGYQAGIAIDVLTRNLFERTADIGFLSTDGPVVSACVSKDKDALAALETRFAAYVQKYSVYSDIILLGCDGQVLARTRPGFGGVSTSEIVHRALTTTASYVETHARTDFCGNEPALTYAYRVEHAGRAVGVLALHFDMLGEARTIFGRLASPNGVIAFLNAKREVVLSSDRLALPAGYALRLQQDVPSVRLGGQQYIVAERQAAPYQGYAGPGWSALALMPADLAFEQDGHAASNVPFTGEHIFSKRLTDIPASARDIQRQLDRMVWNGRLQQCGESNTFSRSLLQEIAETGRKTKAVFEQSSLELRETAAASLLDEVQFLSGLSVDILDRNLYERANDCRWWAASPALATLDPQVARKTLAYINGLYTVYTNVILFDHQGRVVATSAEPALEGQVLTDEWVARCLRVRDAAGYVVSPFETSALYAGRGTYIYAAPLFDKGAAIGGVGLVFDSAPQFEAMLRAALPANDGACAAFVRSGGEVISQSSALPLPLPRHVLALVPGEAWSGVLVHEGQCFAVGATAGHGYKEFKISDGYRETVLGVVVVACGTVRAERVADLGRFDRVDDGEEIATFYIGEQLVGVPTKDVIECVDVAHAVRTPRGTAGTRSRHVGYARWRDSALALLDLTDDLSEMVRAQRHAVVLRHEDTTFGLLASDLGAIAPMTVSDEPYLQGLGGKLNPMTRIAKAGQTLVPLLSAAYVLAAAGIPIVVRQPAVRSDSNAFTPTPATSSPQGEDRSPHGAVDSMSPAC